MPSSTDTSNAPTLKNRSGASSNKLIVGATIASIIVVGIVLSLNASPLAVALIWLVYLGAFAFLGYVYTLMRRATPAAFRLDPDGVTVLYRDRTRTYPAEEIRDCALWMDPISDALMLYMQNGTIANLGGLDKGLGVVVAHHLESIGVPRVNHRVLTRRGVREAR